MAGLPRGVDEPARTVVAGGGQLREALAQRLQGQRVVGAVHERSEVAEVHRGAADVLHARLRVAGPGDVELLEEELDERGDAKFCI